MSAGTILMVEPNPGILIVARNVLSRAGYAVLAVSHIEDGVALAQDGGPLDLILVDGSQADPHRLASLHETHRVPVVLTFQRGKQVGDDADLDATLPGVAAADFLEKPFAPERLLHTVQRVLTGWMDDEGPMSRHDTLVSVEAVRIQTPYGDDFADSDKTDIFPFAHMLEQARTAPSSLMKSRGAARDARAGQLAEHLRNFLEAEGVNPRPDLMSACLRACDAALEAAAEVHTLTPEGVATPSIQGGIPQLSIDQVLQLAMAVGQPSRCRIYQDTAAIDVFYHEGNIAFARHAGLPEGFLLGQMLVSSGRVRESELRQALRPRRDGFPLGQRLVSSGSLTPAALAEALRTQTEELVFEVVRWSAGRFEIYAHEALPSEARMAGQTLAVPHLLLEAMRRLDEWRRIQPNIGDLETVLRPVPTRSIAQMAQLSAEQRALLRLVDGRRTVAEVVRTVARPTYHVYRSLNDLAGRGLLSPC